MSTKHESLSCEELNQYDLNSELVKQVDLFQKNNFSLKKSDIRILDWGCGRGRSVLKLLELGYDAYGVDLDSDVLTKGTTLFSSYGFNISDRLVHMNDLNRFPSGFFHIIFSEQVFEHVQNLDQVLKELSRLTAPGGIGYHIFPAAKMFEECHLDMPLVHWFPKNWMRKFWIIWMMTLGKRPVVPWPSAKNSSFFEEVNIYYNYVNNKTFYRDNNFINKLFEKHGFKSDYTFPGIHSKKRQKLPNFLQRNGFPNRQVRFYVTRMNP